METLAKLLDEVRAHYYLISAEQYYEAINIIFDMAVSRGCNMNDIVKLGIYEKYP
jgi:hypothetical protein